MKKRVKNKNSLIKPKVTIFLIVSLLVFSIILFGTNQSNIANSPTNSLTGNAVLSNYSTLYYKFRPTAAYYSELNDNRRINLWNVSGELYQSPNGITFNYIDRNKITSDGLPATFRPSLGYYSELDNDPRVTLWNWQGQVYTFSETNQNWVDFTPSKNTFGIPLNYAPRVAYTRNFGGVNRITLVDKNGIYYARQDGGLWQETTQNAVNNWNLPANKEPFAAYAFRLQNGVQGVQIWFNDSNNLPEMREWIYSSVIGSLDATPSYVIKTSEIKGLPPINPTEGYFDGRRNKIVLWFGYNAYESNDGRNFLHVQGVNSTLYCTTNANCPADIVSNYCSETDGSCTRTDTYSCIDAKCVITLGTEQCTECASGTCDETTNSCTLTCTADSVAEDCGVKNSVYSCGDEEALYNITSTPSCSSGVCNFDLTYVNLGTCPIGCINTTDNAFCDEYTQVELCLDNDAGYEGIDTTALGFYNASNVSFYNEDNEIELFLDTCVDSDKLNESLCSLDGMPFSQVYICPNGCSEGKCIEDSDYPDETCVDVDAKNISLASSTNYTLDGKLSINLSDECYLDESVVEYSCENSHLTFDIIPCGTGKECDKGACVEISDDGDGDGSSECLDGETTCLGDYTIICANGEFLDTSATLIPGECGYLDSTSSGTGGENIGPTDSNSTGDSKGLFYAILLVIIFIIISVIAFVIYYVIKKSNEEGNKGSSSHSSSPPSKPSMPPRPPSMPPMRPMSNTSAPSRPPMQQRPPINPQRSLPPRR